jgi:hypothetical protein
MVIAGILLIRFQARLKGHSEPIDCYRLKLDSKPKKEEYKTDRI